jgi:serine/threonine protein kinase
VASSPARAVVEQRYRIIRRIEAGGMAEVFLGEACGVEGFKKRVAIKRVLPHLAQNDNFIQMFLDEARLSARLSHANIVSVFDIVAVDDTYLLVMDFVDGANLKRVLESQQRRRAAFPLAEAIYICTEACNGLSYAHGLRDESGRPLSIVHRDVSPPNLLLTKLGEVKIADFGLAKAGTQIRRTDPGVIKGKYSYLSPEAANGLDVDARADIFSLGIVMWEMLAGRRLFLGETDYDTVKRVQQAQIPRLTPLNPHVDDEFEAILLKALARDRGDRFQTAEEFGDALLGYLFSRRLKVTKNDVARLVNTAVMDEAKAAKPDVRRIERLIEEELLDLNSDVAMRQNVVPPLLKGTLRPITGETQLDSLFEDSANWSFSDSGMGQLHATGSGMNLRADSGTLRGLGPDQPASSASTPPAAPPAQSWRDSAADYPLPPAALNNSPSNSFKQRPSWHGQTQGSDDLDLDQELMGPDPLVLRPSPEATRSHLQLASIPGLPPPPQVVHNAAATKYVAMSVAASLIIALLTVVMVIARLVH